MSSWITAKNKFQFTRNAQIDAEFCRVPEAGDSAMTSMFPKACKCTRVLKTTFFHTSSVSTFLFDFCPSGVSGTPLYTVNDTGVGDLHDLIFFPEPSNIPDFDLYLHFFYLL